MSNRIAITISADQKAAYVTVKKPLGSETLSYSDLIGALHHKKIVDCILEDNLRALLVKEQYDVPVLAAEEVSVVQTESGNIEFLFETNPKRQPAVKEDGRVDFKDLQYIQNVHKGDILAQVTLAQPGEIGRTIFGDVVLPDRVQLPESLAGHNTAFKNNKVIATASGTPIFQENQVHVLTSYVIPGDIDFSTGNIEFVGDLTINGNVQKGFELKIGGNLYVDGFVLGSKITVDGDMEVREGITTQESGFVRCYGNLKAAFIENSTVFCFKKLVCAQAMMHSNVHCLGEILVGDAPDQPGLIVGGKTKCSGPIEAFTVGAKLATPTVIELSAKPENREPIETAKQQFIRHKILRLTDQLHDVSDNIQILQDRPLQASGDDRVDQIEDLLLKRDQLKNEILNLSKQQKKLNPKQSNKPPKTSVLTVQRQLFSGVHIMSGWAKLLIDETVSDARVYEKNQDIVVETKDPVVQGTDDP